MATTYFATQRLDSTIIVSRPQPDGVIVIGSNEQRTLALNFEPRTEQIGHSGTDLVFSFPDGGQVIVDSYFAHPGEELPPIILADGRTMDGNTFMKVFAPVVLEEVVNKFSSGGTYSDDPGDLIAGVDRLGSLGTDYWGREDVPDEWFLSDLYEWEDIYNPDTGGNPGPGTDPGGENPPPDVSFPGISIAFSSSMFEDGQPFKYRLAAGADPATGAADFTYQDGYDPETGMPIIFTVESPGYTFAYSPAEAATPDTVYVSSLTVTTLPGPEQGVVYYNGQPVSAGQVIANPDLNAFSFKPAPYFSGDVNFGFDYTLTSEATGPATDPQSADGVFHVDSVADLADADSEATGQTGAGDDITLGNPDFEDGWAEQDAEGASAMFVTFDLNLHFYDLDGSEVGWVDIKLPQGFTIPAGSDYEAYSDATGNYARIYLPDLPALVDANGDYTLPVTLVMDNSATAGNKDLSIRVYTRETDGLDSDGHSTENNQSVREIEQDIDVDILPGSLVVKVGWAYEGDKYEEGTSIGDLRLDGESTTTTGAPITFSLENGTITGGTITIDPAYGTLYYGTTPLVPDANGTYTLTGAQLNSQALVFKPMGTYDGDVPISYELTAQTTTGVTFTFHGDTTAVVDAVADAGTINTDPTALVDADNETFTVSVNATFIDVDGSERHFILVEYNQGWTSPDPYDLIVVWYDADGNPLRPEAYDPSNPDYSYDTAQAAYFITYFRFDVTDQSLAANGNAATYQVRVRPPEGATDMELQVLTMAEEMWQTLDGREYDIGNNVAFEQSTVLINVVDSRLFMTGTAAYENHNPTQNQGNTVPISTDGVITINLSQNGDSIDTTSSEDIVFTFTYDGPGDPGSFTSSITGVTYTFGLSANYTRIPGTNQYQITIPANSAGITPGTDSFSFRYNPPLNDDTDLTDLYITVPVLSGEGQTGTAGGGMDMLVVDAVANKPTEVEATPEYDPGTTAAQSGATIEVGIRAQFDDYEDGSESHYLVFDFNSGFASIDPASLPPGVTILYDAAAREAAGLIAFTDTDRFFVVEVSNEYLQANGGLVDWTILAGIDQVTQDTTLNLNFVAVSVDHSTDGGEVSSNNNYAATPGSGSVVVHVVSSEPVLNATIAFENDNPNEHISGGGNGAASLSLSGMDPSEYLESLTISFETSAGQLWSSDPGINGPITPGSHTLSNGLTLTCTESGGRTTITINGGTPGADVADQVPNLSFVPANNYSDTDVPLDYSGTIVDAGSGESKAFNAEAPLQVVVDAVAQQPLDPEGVVTYPIDPTTGLPYSAASNEVTITTTATFRDTADGSETHYLLIEVKSYFDLSALLGRDGITLTTIAFDAAGNPLSPNANGTGWLNPDPASPGDYGANPASTTSFIQIPVDEIIGRFDQNAPSPQPIGNFTVSLNPDGSYTVSYAATIGIDRDRVGSDIVDEPLLTGGVSREAATPGGGDGTGGREGYQYNNTGYGLDETTISVAVVETINVSVVAGWATEQNSPEANQGTYNTGTGAGLLAVRTVPDSGQDYSAEQLTIVFTYNCQYKDAGGNWVLPGTIVYDYPGGTPVETVVDPFTGLVTVTVIVSTGDTVSILDSNTLSADPNTQAGQVDQSHIRFIPGDNYSDADVNFGYTVRAEDRASGATESVGGGAGTVVIDAVADLPVIDDVAWNYGTDGEGNPYTAFGTTTVTLSFTADFPDTGFNGVQSEGQYILIRQNTQMDLSPAFKQAVADAGYTIETYVVAGDTTPYYRIPAAFFEAQPGTHTYSVLLEFIMTGNVAEGTLDPGLVILAQAVVQNSHGEEIDTSNNSAQAGVDVPDLDFAFVDTTVTGGESQAYEDDTPNANTGDYTEAEGVQFSLGLNIGPSLIGNEVVSEITFTYDTSHGTLAYNDGITWINVPSGGAVPAQFQDSLRYTPVNSKDFGGLNGLADIDQLLHYSLTVTEPASGASKTIEGDYRIVMDAVADKPIDLAVTSVTYSNPNGTIGHGDSVTFTVSATFPDFMKAANGHSDFYILVQLPGANWTTSYPGADIYTYADETYFRIPVDPSLFDANGNLILPITLTAPPTGYLLYENSQPIDIYATTVARDPNKGTLPPGDREPEFDNNVAYSDAGQLQFNYDEGDDLLIVVDPIYENNHPDGNLLNPDGTPNTSGGGGKVHLTDNVNGTPVEYVEITWNSDDGDLYDAGGNLLTPPGGGTVTVRVPAGDMDGLYFQNAPDRTNSDQDWDTVTVEYFDSGDNSLGTASYNPIVDAVAQVPTDLDSSTDYGTDPGGDPYEAAPTGEPVDIVVEVTFSDLSDNEDRFVLVEYKDGWSLPDGTDYTIILGPDGKQYWQIPVDDADIDPVTGRATVTVPVIPPADGTGGTIGADGRTYYDLSTGAMTTRGPVDNEYRDDNNTSYNMTGSTEVVTSTAESVPVLNVTNTYAGNDNDGSGVANPNLSANLYVTGLNQGSDTISEITLSWPNENGTVTYNGVPLTDLPSGVTWTESGGVVTAVITDPAIIGAMVNGSAGSSAVQYVPETYDDTDVTINASFVVNDNFSSDSKTVGNSDTVIVDAVALKPTDVTIEITDPDFNGAVGAGVEVPFAITATFHDLDNDSSQHYLAIEQLSGWTFAGGALPPEISIQTYDGVTYYVIDVEEWGGRSPYLVDNGNGSYTFNVTLVSPDSYTSDSQGADNIRGGAVVVETPTDQEITYDNNTAVVTDDATINIGVVETAKVDFVVSPIVEDAAAGSAITISAADRAALAQHNERVTDSELTFSGDFSGYAAGEQVGTIIYNGVAYPLLSNGDGTASAAVSFGNGGYDPSADFRVVWGTVATNPDGTVQYGGDGNPLVTDWNHTGSNMTLSSTSSVVDNASNESKSGVPGSGNIDWQPTADAPTDLEASDPAQAVGSGAPVTFTVSGQFADVDGSEQHYFLVEQLPGWTGNYQTITVDGVSYFLVPISDSTNPNPSVNVTLNTPPGITADGDITLAVSGYSVDGGSTAISDTGTSVTVSVGVVNATGISLSMGDTVENQGEGTSMTQMLFGWQGTPDNDSITSIVITDLQGGTIVDAAGNVLFAGAPAALDPAMALAGGYFYMPPEYGSGDYTVSFRATARDNESGATTTFTNQSGTVAVTPVSTTPEDPAGTAGVPVNEAGHQARVPVTLSAAFPDNDGSESHFFLVQLPGGVTPPSGWTAITDPALIALAQGMGLTGPFYRVEATSGSGGSQGSASFTLTLPENSAAQDVEFLAVASEQALSPPQYAASPDTGTVTLPPTGEINLAPTVVEENQSLANASGNQVGGTVQPVDPDGDALSVSSVTVNGSALTLSGGVYTGTGLYGTFVFDPSDWSYTYTASGSGSGTDVLEITVTDGNGGTSTSSVTVDVEPVTRALPGLLGLDGDDALLAALAGADDEERGLHGPVEPTGTEWPEEADLQGFLLADVAGLPLNLAGVGEEDALWNAPFPATFSLPLADGAWADGRSQEGREPDALIAPVAPVLPVLADEPQTDPLDAVAVRGMSADQEWQEADNEAGSGLDTGFGMAAPPLPETSDSLRLFLAEEYRDGINGEQRVPPVAEPGDSMADGPHGHPDSLVVFQAAAGPDDTALPHEVLTIAALFQDQQEVPLPGPAPDEGLTSGPHPDSAAQECCRYGTAVLDLDNQLQEYLQMVMLRQELGG